MSIEDGLLSGSVTIWPTECHRTTKANLRFHLDGGPQGWNPHFRTACCAGRSPSGHNVSSCPGHPRHDVFFRISTKPWDVHKPIEPAPGGLIVRDVPGECGRLLLGGPCVAPRGHGGPYHCCV